MVQTPPPATHPHASQSTRVGERSSMGRCPAQTAVNASRQVRSGSCRAPVTSTACWTSAASTRLSQRRRPMLKKSDRVTVTRAVVLLVVVASINALVSTGFATAYVFATPSDPTAGYALVRAVVLAVVLVVAVFMRSATAILVSGLALALAQAGDAVVGFHGGSLPTTIGALVIALATLVCLIGFRRSLRSAAHDEAAKTGK